MKTILKYIKQDVTNHENLYLRLLERLVKRGGYEELDYAENQLCG